MSSIDENENSNFENNISSFPVTPIKIKVFSGFDFPSDKLNSNDYNNIYDNSFNSSNKNSLRSSNEINFCTKNGSNKNFWSKNYNRKNSMNKISEKNNNNEDELYKQKEFCKKFCGEKLFKDLDLNQRFYLKKTGEVHIHAENCKLFKRHPKEIKKSSVPLKFREKRKTEVEKNLSLLDFSLAGVRSKSFMMDNNNSKIINNKSK